MPYSKDRKNAGNTTNTTCMYHTNSYLLQQVLYACVTAVKSIPYVVLIAYIYLYLVFRGHHMY